MTWQNIVATYHALPEGQRTTPTITSKLRPQGHSVSEEQVAQVLRATVLGERITTADLKTTARVLQTLRDFEPTVYRYEASDYCVHPLASYLTRGLPGIDGYEAYQISESLSWLLHFFREAQELDRQQAYEKGLPSRNGRRRRSDDDDIPF